MAYRTRIKYTSEQKSEIWDRWKRGESLRSIDRVFDSPSSSIFVQLAPTGGIRPVPRRRSGLTLAEREEISRGIAVGQSMRWIAASLDRSPSTISREITRNGGLDCYRAGKANQSAWDKAHRPKSCKLANHPELREAVAGKLMQKWSPVQIAGWLKREYPDSEEMQVSTKRSIRLCSYRPEER